MIFKFGGQLQPVEIEEWEAERSPAVFVTDARHAEETLARAGIIYENEIRLEKIGFCKIENQQECVAGTLCIPKLLDEKLSASASLPGNTSKNSFAALDVAIKETTSP